jgi:iron(III) transport system ATP-binding protein
MQVQLRNIIKRFDKSTIVDGVSLDIASGELFFLLGPSGCGKTTLLRMLAGFYDPDEGDILFGAKRMNGIPPYDRNTALVFQNYAVWPHLSVFENVAYGLRVRKIKDPDLTSRTLAALDKVKMTHLKERKPAALSGGQQQRVALARAIVVNPNLLLFDEPLSNLDAKLRIELRDEIKRLHAETKTTSVYVTHDQEEALSLASRIAVMNGGTIQQLGTPYEIYNNPANPFVATFIGEMNLYPAGSKLAATLGGKPGHQVGFRPEHVEPFGDGIPVTVLHSSYLGSKNQTILRTADGDEMKAWLPGYHPEGTQLKIRIADSALRHFAAESI